MDWFDCTTNDGMKNDECIAASVRSACTSRQSRARCVCVITWLGRGEQGAAPCFGCVHRNCCACCCCFCCSCVVVESLFLLVFPYLVAPSAWSVSQQHRQCMLAAAMASSPPTMRRMGPVSAAQVMEGL